MHLSNADMILLREAMDAWSCSDDVSDFGHGHDSDLQSRIELECQQRGLVTDDGEWTDLATRYAD